ncbi:MAG TPA: SRPBCC family protein [Polyangia bacterium]
MKWLLIVGAALVAVIAVVVIVGALLPRDHVATMTARIPAPPEAVWAAITDPSQFPQWRRDVQRVELLPPSPNGPSWREFSRNGAITMVVDVSEPPRHLVGRIADEHLPFGGYWDYRIEPDGAEASKVTVAEHGSVYNPVFRFVSRFIMGHTATIDAYLRALGKRFGGDAEPTAVATTGAADGT